MSKILIAGIGGVGGYFGGLLAKAHHQSKDLDIYFLSRGESLLKIKAEGIRVLDDDNEFTAYPDLISDDVQDFGVVDYVLICTKAYSLAEVAKQLAPCISTSTVLVPLQNGVNSRDILLEAYTSNLVTHGCVYLISRLQQPGCIVKKGQLVSLYFGLNNTNDDRLQYLQEILVKSGINSELSEDIDKVTWEKFIFLSSIATATTYFDADIHDVLENTENLEALKHLIGEVTELAHAKEINIGGNQTTRVLDLLYKLPTDATSSMHTDFKNHKAQTELESLTGFVVTEGKRNSVSMPTFERMYTQIKPRINKN